jgi:hypothetical protein
MPKFFMTSADKKQLAVNLDLVRVIAPHPSNPQTTVITFDAGHALMVEQPIQDLLNAAAEKLAPP